MKRDQVVHILARQRKELYETYAVKSLALFGSVARNEARSDSDVDLLVEFSRPVGLFQFIGLKQCLESLLGCPVDLGTPTSLKPQLKESVMREAIHVAQALAAANQRYPCLCSQYPGFSPADAILLPVAGV